MQKRSELVVQSPDEIKDETEYFDHPLLIEEPPLQVLPALAVALGLEEAIVVQQLHYLLRHPKNGRLRNGERWIFNTYEQWNAMFPFWSERTIRRVFSSLEQMQIVISCQPEGGFSRRKYYRLSKAMLIRLRAGTLIKPNSRLAKLAASSGQDGPLIRPNWPLPHSKSTAKTTRKESKGAEETGEVSPAAISSEFPASWKPNVGTKAQKLARIKPPKDYPSEAEFDQFIDDEDLGQILNYRSDMYLDLCRNKFHRWKEAPQKWERIRDWKAFVRALNEKIETGD